MLPKISHPLSDVEIPSTKKRISYRPMLAREEKILLMARESEETADSVGAVKQVVRNCIVNEDVNVDKLTTFDVDYIFLKIRAVSVGNKVNITNNETKENYTINLNDVKVVFPREKQEGDPYLLKITDKIGLKLRDPRAEIYGNPQLIGSDTDSIDRLMAHCLDKVYENDKIQEVQSEKYEDILEFLDSLDIESINKIRAFLSTIPHLYYAIELKDAEGKPLLNDKGEPRKIELNNIFSFFAL